MSAARGLDPLRWIGVPMLQALVATVLLGIPLRIFGLQLPEPVFPLAVVYAWAVIRPSVLAPVAILIMGVFLDVFWGTSLGFWELLLLLAYGVILAARSIMAGQSQPILWGWYALVVGLAMTLGYLISMLDVKAAPGLLGIAWQFLATIVLYPLAQRLIDMFDDADVRFR
jgi:rod shape-determining protein MreD